MADYLVYAQTSDFMSFGYSSTSWLDARAGTSKGDNPNTTVYSQIGVGLESPWMYAYQGFLDFNTSGVPANQGYGSSSKIKLYVYNSASGAVGTSFGIRHGYDWPTTLPFVPGASITSTGTNWGTYTFWGGTGYFEWLHSTQADAAPRQSSWKIYVFGDAQISTTAPTDAKYIYIYAADNSGTSTDPHVLITVEDPPPPPAPKGQVSWS